MKNLLTIILSLFLSYSYSQSNLFIDDINRPIIFLNDKKYEPLSFIAINPSVFENVTFSQNNNNVEGRETIYLKVKNNTKLYSLQEIINQFSFNAEVLEFPVLLSFGLMWDRLLLTDPDNFICSEELISAIGIEKFAGKKFLNIVLSPDWQQEKNKNFDASIQKVRKIYFDEGIRIKNKIIGSQ